MLTNKTFLILMVLISGYGYILSCTHDNEIPPPPASNNPVINRGTRVHLPRITNGDTNTWKFDKSHSSVLWQTNYQGAAGLLTGRFNQFGLHNVTPDKYANYNTSGQPLPDTSWAFYENEPGKTYFNGYVQINTSNTGEPGRDAGCNLKAMGNSVAPVTGVQSLLDSNIAKIQTTEVKFDPASNGYIVTLNLTYKGRLETPLTKPIVGKLTYIPRSNVTIGTVTNGVFGLQLRFQFNCREFGITSTSISDIIEVECNINFNNKP